MATPTHLKHKPITTIDDYSRHDGKYANQTDVESLTIGKAQYDNKEISAKVFRKVNGRWSRQSEELPLHRVFDLGTMALKSILLSANIEQPSTTLNVSVVEATKLQDIVSYYNANRDSLLPKLQELQKILSYFINEESNLSEK